MANDPYEELGVDRNASDEQIKAAYKELVKKYHPDKYQGNPLGDLAEEKLRDVNEAYDQIMNERKSGAGYGAGGAGYGAGATYGAGYSGRSASPEYQEIRRDIDANNLKRAQDKLDAIPDKNVAEWWFLSGMISYKRGWYDDATGKIQKAVSMEPSNMEYRNALNALAGAGGMYQQQAYNRGYRSTEDAFCQALQCYCCADMCCDCC